MIKGEFCKTTCGRCKCHGQEESSKVPAGCDCTDIPPPTSKFSCASQVRNGMENHFVINSENCFSLGTIVVIGCGLQKHFGKCDKPWMVNGGHCEYTCGRCQCTSPKVSSLRIKPPVGCSCGDIAPRGEHKELPCAEQVG